MFCRLLCGLFGDLAAGFEFGVDGGKEEAGNGIEGDVGNEAHDDFVDAAFGFGGLGDVAPGGEIKDAGDNNAENGGDADADSEEINDELEDGVDAATFLVVLDGTEEGGVDSAVVGGFGDFGLEGFVTDGEAVGGGVVGLVGIDGVGGRSATAATTALNPFTKN